MEKIETRIAALLAKAESTTPQEAEALTAKAAEMMMKYGIDQARINEARLGGSREGIVQSAVFHGGVYANSWVLFSHYIVSGMGGMRSLRARAYGKGRGGKMVKGWNFITVGFENDVKQADVLVKSLSLQCVAAMARWQEEAEWRMFMMPPSQKTGERKGFIEAYGAAAGGRLRDLRTVLVEQSESESPGALVVMDRRKSEVDAFVDDIGPRKGRAATESGSWEARMDGSFAGRQADVGQARVAAGATAEIGG